MGSAGAAARRPTPNPPKLQNQRRAAAAAANTEPMPPHSTQKTRSANPFLDHAPLKKPLPEAVSAEGVPTALLQPDPKQQLQQKQPGHRQIQGPKVPVSLSHRKSCQCH